MIPKIVNWQRASFYFTCPGTRSRNPYNQASWVPSLAERGGDFSDALVNNQPVTIYDPLSGAPFPNNTVPQSRISPVALGLLPYFPLPTFGGSVQNLPDRPGAGAQLSSEQLFGFRDPATGTGISASAGWSHSFATRFNNSATLTSSRNSNDTVPCFAYGENIAAVWFVRRKTPFHRASASRGVRWQATPTDLLCSAVHCHRPPDHRPRLCHPSADRGTSDDSAGTHPRHRRSCR